MRRSISIVLGVLCLSGCGAELAEVDPGGTATSGAGGDASVATSLGTGSSDSASSTSHGSTAGASGDGQTSGSAEPGADGSTSADSGASTSAGVGDTTAGMSSTDSVGSASSTGSGSTGGGSTGAPASPACDDLYGEVPEYVLCDETDTSCSFNAHTGSLRPRNCDAMCQKFGGTCLMAFDNPNTEGEKCDVIEPNADDCTTTRTTELCVCSKP